MESKPSARKGGCRKDATEDARVHQLYSFGQNHQSLILPCRFQTF
jgi:hypothetical protein